MRTLPPRHVGFEAGAWHDVTRALVPGHPNWPGDTPLALRTTAAKASGDSVNVMALCTSTHAGTHLDAPYHYDEAGARLGGVPLADLMGPCLVLDVQLPAASAGGSATSAGGSAASAGGSATSAGGSAASDVEAVGADALLAALERLAESEPFTRVLLKTGQRDAWPAFPTYRPLSVALVEALAERGVRLLGTDAPSVDAFTSKPLPVHAACARQGLWIVEGLALAAIPEGVFELLCLPLRLPTADASPVRALLRPLG